jgi:filamentous hemagglutinin family protein
MPRRQIPQRLRAGQLPAPAPAAAGHRPVLLALALAAGFTAAQAQPNMQPIHGTAVPTQNGSTLVITTTNGANSNHSAINWQSFNVPAGSTTRFEQPGVHSTSINRVMGSNPSAIFGTLWSNGKLVLVNPNGITVGAGAVVDTAGFTASTLRMTDADAILGRMRFGDGLGGGPLRVDGKVLARSGDVVLVGSDVQVGAGALVESPNGATVLAAGRKVEVTGRGLEGIFFELQAPSDQAVNLGKLQGDAVGVFAGTLKHSGHIVASAVTAEGGRVVLRAASHAETSGRTVAQGANGAGGQVDVLGHTVGVMAGAVVDTSNTHGGGQIRVGGDYLGQNAEVPNAFVTYVDDAATLRANATANGDGGRVIVWADDTTRAHGTIEARGGADGGNGGFVETSGQRVLQTSASVDTSAAKGQTGQWLLDPNSITIGSGSPPLAPDNAAADPLVFTGSATDSYIDQATLNTALNGKSNVRIVTSGAGGDITFNAGGASMTFDKASTGTTTLDLDASGDIRFTNGTTRFLATDTGDAGRLDINLNSATQQVRIDSGATLEAATTGTANAVKLKAANGTTWTNSGNLTLNLNATVDLDGSVFQNNGTVTMLAGSGGIAGAAGTGVFNNSGTVNLLQGVVRLGALNNLLGGTFTTNGANADLTVLGGFTNAGVFNFRGRDLSITQSSGLLDLGTDTTGIDAYGTVQLKALNGGIHLDRDVLAVSMDIDAVTGSIQAENSAFKTRGASTQDGPGVRLHAGGSISYREIDTSGTSSNYGGKVTVTADNGGVTGGDITARGNQYGNGGGGSVSVTSGGATGIVITGDIDTRAGSLGTGSGSVTLLARNSGGVSVGTISTSGTDNNYGGAAASAGNVSVTAGGNITVDGVYAEGGSSSTSSVGGGAGGLVSMVSNFGNVTVVGGIDVYGGDNTSSGAGGNGGGVTVSAAGRVELGSIDAYGGNGGYARAGGTGGAVGITGGELALGIIDVHGGAGGAGEGGSGGAGGDAGGVSLTQTAGTMNLSDTSVYAYGGYGGESSNGGAGGRGGTINVVSAGGIEMEHVSYYAPALSAHGGTGGMGYSGTGGRGGDGGAINISAGAASKLMGSLYASGGSGGDAEFESSAVGGTGGNGGAINISVAGGALSLGGEILAGSGLGGQARTYSFETYDYLIDATRAGQRGAVTGTLAITAPGGIVVPSTMRSTPAPSSPPPSGPPAVAAIALPEATTQVPTRLYVDAQWTNNNALTLQSGSTVLLGQYDYYSSAFIPSGQALVNGSAGVIQGSGTIDGSVVSSGVVAPGGQGGIGRLVITGDYSQAASGFLDMDVAANTPYLPGRTYDQLVVGGTANLGGQLRVAAIPEVPTASVNLATARQMVVVSDAPTQFLELIQASAATGSFSLKSGPANLMGQIRMNIGGQLVEIPGGTAAGLIAALQALLPGTSLAQLQQVLVETFNNSISDEDDDKDKLAKKKGDDIVVTDTSCKTS